MKYCSKCKTHITGSLTYCPLCQSELVVVDETVEELYPSAYENDITNHMILKIFAFISVVVSILSVFINIIVPARIWWSLIVVATFVCLWISLLIAISKHKNILKYLLHQSIVISLFSIFLDYSTGRHGWAITFVIPVIFTLAMIVMYMLSKILHLQAGEYMIYLLLDALFGIIPIIFLVTDSVKYTIPSFICIMVSLSSVTALIIFEGQTMFSELKRRLHI